MPKPTETITPLLVDTTGAARLLGVCNRTIINLTNDGKIPAVRVRGAVRYAVADLNAFVDANRTAAGV